MAYHEISVNLVIGALTQQMNYEITEGDLEKKFKPDPHTGFGIKEVLGLNKILKEINNEAKTNHKVLLNLNRIDAENVIYKNAWALVRLIEDKFSYIASKFSGNGMPVNLVIGALTQQMNYEITEGDLEKKFKPDPPEGFGIKEVLGLNEILKEINNKAKTNHKVLLNLNRIDAENVIYDNARALVRLIEYKLSNILSV